MKILISYSHVDEKWLRRVLVHLKPLSDRFQTDIWSDKRIQPGTKWQAEIQTAIASSQICIALISPDFLASDFIAQNELPPLLHGAATGGKKVILLIVGPSLFEKLDELSVFQAFNDPQSSLLSMSEYEREATFSELSIYLFDLLAAATPAPVAVQQIPLMEDFLLPADREKLIVLGKWLFDADSMTYIGEGVNSFLVSRNSFGSESFEFNATLAYHKLAAEMAVNTGLMFGWNTDARHPRYYNILLSGKDLLLERVGYVSETHPNKAEHLTAPIPFPLANGQTYTFRAVICKAKIQLYIDSKLVLETIGLEYFEGRVGIRAWRCQVTCKRFAIRSH